MSGEVCYVWCPHCGVRLTKEEIKGWGCPKCGSQSVPCDPEEDVWVEVNWHELRVLACFAERWAQQIKDEKQPQGALKTVYGVCSRLEKQWPNFTPLTLGREIQQLPQALADRGMSVDLVKSTVPDPLPVTEYGPGAVGHSRQRQS